MIRRRLLIAAAVVFTGLAAGYWHVAGMIDWRGIGNAPTVALAPDTGADRPTVEAETAAVQPPTGASDGAAGTQTPDAAADEGLQQAATPESPTIDLLRVEPDGDAVLAGRAAPNASVVVLSQGVEIGRETASASGEFAIVLSDRLGVGDHQLTLRASGADGTTQNSSETAVVSVPPRGRESELLVMLQSPNRPAEIIERPTPAVVDDASAAVAPPVADAADAPPPPEDASRQMAAVDARPEPGVDAQMPVAPPFAPSTEPALGIGAIEIEGGQLYVAGGAAAGAKVRLYVDGAFVGETEGRAQGDFYANVPADIAVGRHVVRADAIGPDGTVVSRVEVPFDRPNEGAMSAVAQAATPASDVASVSTAPGVPASSGPTGPAPIAANVPDASSPTPSEAAPIVATPTHPAQMQADTETTGEPQASVTQQAALQPVEGRVLIRRGDTLWRISRETYGQGARYTVIYLANGDQIRNPNLIYPGQIFRMPEGSSAN